MNPFSRVSLVLVVLVAALALAPAAGPQAAAFAVAPPWQTAPSQVALQEGGQITTYVVQKGDSLSRIGARFGVSIEQLMSANALTTTTLQPGQVLVIPVVSAQPPASIYSRVSGTPAFIGRVKAALDWLQANDADAFARADGYVTVITASRLRNFATARPMPGGGCAVQALARPDMVVQMTAALLYHEASHCYQFATAGLQSSKPAEVYAYTEQIAFMERHGFPEDVLAYYRRILEYYQSQPDDGQYVPPPNF